jgi:hypothetical protein
VLSFKCDLVRVKRVVKVFAIQILESDMLGLLVSGVR